MNACNFHEVSFNHLSRGYNCCTVLKNSYGSLYGWNTTHWLNVYFDWMYILKNSYGSLLHSFKKLIDTSLCCQREFWWIQWHPTREISLGNFDNVTLFTAIQILRWLHIFFIECVPTHLCATVLHCIKDQLDYNTGLLQSETLAMIFTKNGLHFICFQM